VRCAAPATTRYKYSSRTSGVAGWAWQVSTTPAASSSRGAVRLGHRVAGLDAVAVDVPAAELPYVTVLLRVRGNTAAERWARIGRPPSRMRSSGLAFDGLRRPE
jgi:hypothetical protein